jgi:hypothetical protein
LFNARKGILGEVKMKTIRQGDVALIAVKQLPAGCVPVENEGGRIVLAHGEVTGHAHAIYDHIAPGAAAEIAEAAIARARLLVAPNGDRFLDVRESVTLKHEEHTAHTIPPGIYELPIQVEHTAGDAVRMVAD